MAITEPESIKAALEAFPDGYSDDSFTTESLRQAFLRGWKARESVIPPADRKCYRLMDMDNDFIDNTPYKLADAHRACADRNNRYKVGLEPWYVITIDLVKS